MHATSSNFSAISSFCDVAQCHAVCSSSSSWHSVRTCIVLNHRRLRSCRGRQVLRETSSQHSRTFFFFQLKRPPASPCVAGKRRQAVFFSHTTSPRLATLFRSFVQAIAYYEKSLSSGQQGSKLRLELAEFLLRLKQYPRAMRVLQKVRSAVCPASVLPKTPF